MKKVISFTLAVIVACSCLVAPAFASSGSSSTVEPDSFLSWGTADGTVELAVPSEALTNHNFIVYCVRGLTWQYVIDVFASDHFPIEGENASFTRYFGVDAFTQGAALRPSFYTKQFYEKVAYTKSKDWFSTPVFSNFDYYDANGKLIIGGSDSGEAFDALMDLTLYDGTVIQVDRDLQGQYFVVARSSSAADQYKIWLFQPSNINAGEVVEGASGFIYFTSYSSLSPSFDISPLPNDIPSWSESQYPYVVIYGKDWGDGTFSGSIVCFESVSLIYYQPGTSSGIWKKPGPLDYVQCNMNLTQWGSFSELDFPSSSGTTRFVSFKSPPIVIFSNFDLLNADGSLFQAANISLHGTGTLEWSSWLTLSTPIDIATYGDIVFQSFPYQADLPGTGSGDESGDDSGDGSDVIPPDDGSGDDSGNDSGLSFWDRVKQTLSDALADLLDSLLNLITKILDTVLGTMYDLLDFFFGLITESVMDGISDFFEAFTSGVLLRFFRVEEPLLDANGDPVLDSNGQPVMVVTTGLPSGVAAVFSFVSGAIMLLPDQLRFVLLFGIGSMFLFAVLKIIRG